jgi:hypothetical protein
MTYLAKAPLRRYRARRPALSDWFEDMIASIHGTQESQCLAQANAAVAPFDAQVDDLVKNWQPTGFYTPTELRSVVSSTLDLVRQAQHALDLAAQSPNASQDSITRATSDLARAGQRSLDYGDAAKAVEQQGLRLVNAPGLKRWVTDTMATASSAAVTVATIGCMEPWWLDALALFQAAFDAAWRIAKAVGGAVLELGEKTLQVAAALPDILDILKWAALAGGAYWLWTHHLNPHR